MQHETLTQYMNLKNVHSLVWFTKIPLLDFWWNYNYFRKNIYIFFVSLFGLNVRVKQQCNNSCSLLRIDFTPAIIVWHKQIRAFFMWYNQRMLISKASNIYNEGNCFIVMMLAIFMLQTKNVHSMTKQVQTMISQMTWLNFIQNIHFPLNLSNFQRF